jgi:hypothetical protein
MKNRKRSGSKTGRAAGVFHYQKDDNFDASPKKSAGLCFIQSFSLEL